MKFGYVSSPLFEENTGDTSTGAGTGGEGNSGVAFDQTAFLKALNTEWDKRLNGTVKNLNKEWERKLEALKPKEETTGGGEGQGEGHNPKNVDPETLALRRQLQEATRRQADFEKSFNEAESKRKAAEESNALSSAISDPSIKWRDAESRDLFVDAIKSRITRNEDGDIGVIEKNEFLPLTEYVKVRMEKYPNLLAPRGDGGAGSRGGSGTGGVKQADLDEIRPFMKAEDKARVQAALAAVRPQR